MKRLFDLLVLAAASPVLLPVMGLTGLLVRIIHGSPIIFRQERGGYRGTRFELLKFRTMTDERDHAGALLPDEQRLTAFGRLLRKSSLDELPCLLNIVKGDMTLVGPRPFIADYLPLYSADQMRRHDVKPGLTGWAQVNGRNAITWEEKFALDLWYVDNRTLWLDVKILAATVRRVINADGVSASDDVTMPRFTGTRIPASDGG